MSTTQRQIRVSESDIPLHGWAPYSEVHRERIRAHAKHSASGESIEQLPADHPIWLAVLTEEVGEVANAIIEHDKTSAELRAELVQVAAVACAWIEALDAA
jgi:NTP pyrophosphatase (non-canonical NTP hydrolase)